MVEVSGNTRGLGQVVVAEVVLVTLPTSDMWYNAHFGTEERERVSPQSSFNFCYFIPKCDRDII